MLSDYHWVTHWKILLVGEDQKQSIPQLILVEHSLEFLASFTDTLSIVGINNEDDTLGVLEIVAPEWTDLVLSSDIPHGEGDVLVFNSLDVEACRPITRKC
jgi:hypothetical protein